MEARKALAELFNAINERAQTINKLLTKIEESLNVLESRTYLDRFYTDQDIVQKILKHLDLNKYDLIIDPSAGDGAFSEHLPNCRAYDIIPGTSQHKVPIQKADFLKLPDNTFAGRNRILAIGNPPFGLQCSLAIKFFKKCARFANDIAFILPKSFRKQSVQNRLPLNFHLKLELDIPNDSFTINNKPHSVPCIFQLWSKQEEPRQKPQLAKPKNFEFTTPKEANLSVVRVGVNAGTASKNLHVSSSSHYFIKTKNPDKLITLINKIKFPHNNTVGPRSISKQELIKKIDNQ